LVKVTKLRILDIDLSSSKVRERELEWEKEGKLFLGGKTLGTYLVYKNVPPGTDPFSPSNVIVFSAGFFSGLVPGASKVSVVSKSPLTRLIHDSHAGDYFGPYLRKAGYIALMVRGKSKDPVYIYVNNENVEVRDASKLWGKTNGEVVKEIRKETNEKASVASIGPAGERLVKIAHIAFDRDRAAGRGGLGAVMGSKNLKAVAVYGDKEVEVHDREKLERLSATWKERLSKDPELEYLRVYGTTNALRYSASVSMSPSYNFTRPWIPEELASKLSGRPVKEREVEAPWYIHGAKCPIKCARYVRTQYKGKEFEVKTEYENLAMLGAATGVFNIDAVLYFNYLVDELGLDSISTGNVIGWLLEMVEKGLISSEEIGFEVKGFGDEEAVAKLIEMIAYRKGIGAILGEGVARASEILARGKEIAVHVKGLEAPAWDPRGRRGFAVSYATADVGASHLRGWPPTTEPPSAGPAKDIVKGLARQRDKDALYDTLGICRFVSYPDEAIVEFYEVITGESRELDDLLDVPKRAEALARIHDVLDHITPPLDDTIPPKWMEPIPEGPLKGVKAFLDENDMKEAIKEYYRVRGWDENYGVPLPETLKRLGLSWALDDAKKALEVVKKRLETGGILS
jgi:aldehyde:ferredoxin oxidoreductase